MSRDPQEASALFTQIDISSAAQSEGGSRSSGHHVEQTELLHQILSALDRNNELLEEFIGNATAGQRQRAGELQNWRQANPGLADSCKRASDSLARVQSEFLRTLTEEIEDNADAMEDGDFVFNEFVDRFGPRLAHLNGVLQMLSQLSNAPSVAHDD